MLKPADNYFLHLPEPDRSCLQFLRSHILSYNEMLKEEWKYGMPFYCIGGKMCCYLWRHKKYNQPYLGIVEGAMFRDPELLQEKRARMKILLIDPSKNMPLKKINNILKSLVAHYTRMKN